MDRELPPLSQDRALAPVEYHQYTYSQAPPTRVPPPTPLGIIEQAGEDEESGNHTNILQKTGPLEPLRLSEEDSNGDDIANYTNRLREDGPPSRMPPIPDGGHAEQSRSLEHTECLAKHSPSPSLPNLLTQAAPSRAKSTSPHALDYRRTRAGSFMASQSQPDFSTFRSVSTPLNLRPNSTSYLSDGEGGMEAMKHTFRKSGNFMGDLFSSSRKNSVSEERGSDARAWIYLHDGKGGHSTQVYSVELLLNGQQIPELWERQDFADLYLYLYPRTAERESQIKCPSLVIQNSRILLDLAREGSQGRRRARSFDGRGSLTIEDARNMAVRSPASPPYTPKLPQEPQSASDTSNESVRSFGSTLSAPRELHLYLPIGIIDEADKYKSQPGNSAQIEREREEREQKLVDVRNLFAFLNGQPIMGTRKTPSPFRIFLAIASLLKFYGFTDEGDASYGPAANASFEFYLLDYRFADVRESREKTLEGLILGEAMRSEALYREAFAHAVGKYKSLATLKSPLWDELSTKTRKWIERGYLQLKTYNDYAEECLTDFEFPSVFAGLAASTSSKESKLVKFKSWKSNFMAMRKAVLSYYKKLHGSWPPKASSKKNDFVEGGLNRLVLKGLYGDLCCLYDFLVDRNNITTRGLDSATGVQDGEPTVISTLRKLLDEYDKSTTWTTPTMPFDVPNLPTIATVDPNFNRADPKEQHKLWKRKLEHHEIAMIMAKGHNLRDGQNKYRTPFMDMYLAFEDKESKGKNARELEEQRIGHWIFLYAVIQVLPLLISDAPRLRYTSGVEYFLSATPPENMPWVENARFQMNLYHTADGAVNLLPAHQVEYGMNSIYSRSHCWQMASSWLEHEEDSPQVDVPPAEGQLSPLSPPPGFGGGELGSRPSARGRERAFSAGGVKSLSPNGLLSPIGGNRSQTRLSQRNSIALGLEQLPRCEGEEVGLPSSNRVTPEKEMTFDDILGGMEQSGGKKKKGKK